MVVLYHYTQDLHARAFYRHFWRDAATLPRFSQNSGVRAPNSNAGYDRKVIMAMLESIFRLRQYVSQEVVWVGRVTSRLE